MQEAEGKEAREATAVSVCFGIESKQLAFPVHSACILYRPAVRGGKAWLHSGPLHPPPSG